MKLTLTVLTCLTFTLPALRAGVAEELFASPAPATSPAFPGSFAARPNSAPAPRSWKWSIAPLIASQTLDVASSYGMRELNPALAGPDGRFGAKGASLKLGLTGALLGVEYLIVKVHPGAARFFTSINWSGAALTTGFAVHNYSIR